ncbi:MAG: hypothetical protein LBC99_03970 [Spirochaetota bacterium]|jgi:hypothetical protein|nr:hypothetical protein [Spirochaetota bacterium]
MKMIRLLSCILAALLVMCAAAASDQSGYTTRVHTLAGEPLSVGEQVSVGYRAYIPKKKKNDSIVILVSGWTCGPAWLHYAAACLAGRHGMEVWTVRRRASFFEDRAAWLADRARPQKAEKYFAGSDPRVLDSIGYGIVLDDLDDIVRAAGKRKQPVILGGWSDGVKFVMAYTHRRFADGKRGHERLAGLLFIDENPEWGTRPPEAMRQELGKKRALAEASVYERRLPDVTVFEALGVLAAESMGMPMGFLAGGESSRASTAGKPSPFAALFPQRPRAEMTDAALLGWLYDGAGMGTSAWGWLVSAGGLDGAQPVGWKNGGNTPIERLAAIHTLPEGVWEWFYPHRIGIDFWEIGLSGFQHEGLRIAPDKNNRLPVFAVLSGFNQGAGFPAGIRWWQERTGIQDDQINLLRFNHFRHADVLLAPAAEEEIWAKFAAWVTGVLK